MIDTHCHPQFPQYDKDRDEMIKKALAEGLKMICVGTDFEMSEKAIELASRYEGIWASVGLHPNDNLTEKFDIKKYIKLTEHPKVVAIGEIGLDYYRTPDIEQQKIQKQRFLEQISLAIGVNKPAIIHCRDGSTSLPSMQLGTGTTSAHDDMLDIVSQNPDLKGVIHSFTGSLAEAEQYIKLGFYIGLNGIITFPPSRKATDGHGAQNYDEVVKQIPLNKILTETDAPYLTPIPHRGQRNEPSYVKFVVQKIAEIRNISLDEVSSITTQNAIELFGIK